MPEHREPTNERRDYLAEERGYRDAERNGWEFARRRQRPGLEPELARIMEWEEFPSPGTHLLELGCGDGYTTRHLLERGLVVDGIDCAPTAIARAQRYLRQHGLAARLLVDDVCRPASLDHVTYPAILDSFCLHCVVDETSRAQFLASSRRLLAPDAALFIATMGAQDMSWAKEGGPDDVRIETDAYGCSVQTRAHEHSGRRVRGRIWVTEERLRGEIAAAGLIIERFEAFSPVDDPADNAFLALCRRTG